MSGLGLPDALAGKVQGELELFSTHMRHRLLFTAISEAWIFAPRSPLLAAEVTELRPTLRCALTADLKGNG